MPANKFAIILMIYICFSSLNHLYNNLILNDISNRLIVTVPDEGYSRNASLALNQISLFYWYKCMNLKVTSWVVNDAANGLWFLIGSQISCFSLSHSIMLMEFFWMILCFIVLFTFVFLHSKLDTQLSFVTMLYVLVSMS